MAEERTRALVGECISRAHVEAARNATVDEIAAACDACDYERAATLVLGRARAGERVPVDVVSRVLPGIELPAITLALTAIVPVAERAQLLALVEGRRFPQVRDAGDLEAIILFAAWRAGGEVARVIPQLRRLSARSLSAESYALLATIAATIDDPNVAAATKPLTPFAKEYAKQVAEDDKTLGSTIDKILATLPAEIEVARAAGFTVRAQKQVGRNDPCPCGSGLKYKKCCADKDEARDATPSPVPGMSYEEFLAGDRLTAEHVDGLGLRDVVRVQLGKLADDVLAAVFKRFIGAHEWAHAERVVAESAGRTGVLGDNLRDELIAHLLEVGDVARARGHVAQLPADMAKLWQLQLALDDGIEPGWHALVRSAREAATDKLAELDLAYTLLRAEPALGIIAARACIGTAHFDDADIMMELVEDARDRLNVAPEDPAWDVLEALTSKKPKQAHEVDANLRESLAASSARVDELERSLAALRSELAQERTRPAAELMRAPTKPGDVDDHRVRELEALIREGNAERRELRRQLETAAAPAEPSRRDGPHKGDPRSKDGSRLGTRLDQSASGPRARRQTIEEGDDDVGDDVEAGARGITIPRFERRAIDALATVPANVAAETMRTVGTLTAGDGFAWKGVKQAKDMVRPVLMARVGIHHRVLFRVEGGELTVIDLITREQLLTTLKRLRANR